MQATDKPQGAQSPQSGETSSALAALSAAAPADARRSYGALWRARLAMMRPGNGLMAAVGVVVGLAVVPHPPLALATRLAAPLAAFLVAGFGNVLNDIRDRRVDARAHPERALPSGQVDAGQAKAFAALLLGFGLWEAYVAAGWPTLAFAGANAGGLVAYELWLKRLGLPGNVLVAALVASTFAFGAFASGTAPLDWGLLWLLIAMAFLANVARELLKDVEDMAADQGERRTLPLEAGAGVARLLAFLLVNAAVLLSVLAFFHSPAGWSPAWLAVLAGADLLFLVGVSLAWMDVGRSQRVLKLAMLAALAAFLAGTLL
jgi:geranylgeranylglycerol-phosphate geranylgeranyltransferase